YIGARSIRTATNDGFPKLLRSVIGFPSRKRDSLTSRVKPYATPSMPGVSRLWVLHAEDAPGAGQHTAQAASSSRSPCPKLCDRHEGGSTTFQNSSRQMQQ